MLNVLANTNATLRVAFMFQGDYEIPDLGSVTYTLYDTTGTPVVGFINVAIVTLATSTSYQLQLAAAQNALGVGNLFETRTVVVSYTVNGDGRTLRYSYRIIPFIPMTVTEDDARKLLGVAQNELPDENIDLVEAYFKCCDDTTQAALNAALISSTTLSFHANEMIAAKALLKSIPMMQMRVMAQEHSGTDVMQRYPTFDFDRMLRLAASLYADAKALITGNAQTEYQMIALVTPIDPITSPY